VVSLTAVPAAGWSFGGWSGAVSGTANPASLTMNGPAVVTATFTADPAPGTLTVSVVGSGSVTKNPDKVSYLPGEVVELTAVPAAGWSFGGWSGAVSGTANPVALAMNGPATVTATFIDGFDPLGIVSDDFHAASLDTGLWAFENPLGDGSVSMSGTQALISVPAGTSHDVWTGGNFAPRLMQVAEDTDFEVEVKFESTPAQKYQMQGLIVEQDAGNYLRFDFHHDGKNLRAFAASVTGGKASVKASKVIAGGNPLYLRVKRAGSQWTHYYSYDGVNWTANVSFTRAMTVTGVGPFAGNAGKPAPPAYTAVVDYFFNTASPIVPEDGP
jgi:regulation of enolase protein 1 (concanavalin A-like superfamily)